MVRTARELCTYVRDAAGEIDRPLDEYLRALWRLGAEHHRAGCAYLTGTELADLLARAFEAPAPPFDPTWRALRDQTIDPAHDGFTTWESTVREQILDLDELIRSGLADASGSFFAVDADAVDAPGGSRWSNLAPRDFLAAACRATFGDIEATLPPIDWDRFACFLARGQLRA